jgi:hypothetical protein
VLRDGPPAVDKVRLRAAEIRGELRRPDDDEWMSADAEDLV